MLLGNYDDPPDMVFRLTVRRLPRYHHHVPHIEEHLAWFKDRVF